MAIAVALPIVQTTDRNVNQLQTNVNQAIQQVANAVFLVTIIGEVKLSPLTLAEFQNQTGKQWVLCDGSNVNGSTYTMLTNNQKVPNISKLAGCSYYIRIN